jgi:hypothetical protein
LLIVLLIGCLVYFYRGAKWLTNDLMQPGQNPELISYLQGDWVNPDNEKIIFSLPTSPPLVRSPKFVDAFERGDSSGKGVDFFSDESPPP